MTVLRWKIFKQERPFGDLHVGFLGDVPVASVEEKGSFDDYYVSFGLPDCSWRTWSDDSHIRCSGRDVFKRLEPAKSAADRAVSKWLADAQLRATEL